MFTTHEPSSPPKNQIPHDTTLSSCESAFPTSVSPISIPHSREELYAESPVSSVSVSPSSAVAYSMPIFHLPNSLSVSPSQLPSSRSYPKMSSLSTTSQNTRATIETVTDGRISPSAESIWESWAYSDSFMDPNPAWINFFNNGRFPDVEPHPLLQTRPREPRDFTTELSQPPRELSEVPITDWNSVEESTTSWTPRGLFFCPATPPLPSPPAEEPAEAFIVDCSFAEEPTSSQLPMILVYPPTPSPSVSQDLPCKANFEEVTNTESLAALDSFFATFPSSVSRRSASSALARIQDTIPPSPSGPYSVLQMAGMWLSRCYSPCFLFETGLMEPPPAVSAFAYKRVANKTRPVATTLPEDFRIVRRDHPNPLASLSPLPTHPPNFAPTARITQERRDQMELGKDFLLPEEIKLVEWILCTHDTAFAWTDEERGAFDPEYFAPIEIPHIAHVPWVLRQGPIPRGILDKVTEIIENKWRSGVYEPSSSSYNSRWFCVFKKDGKSLRLVHSLEPLNAVTIKNAAMPPYTDVVAEDFAGRSIYTTLDLYVSFDQRQLHANSRDMTTFNTPLGAFRLTVLPMGWTNSPAVLQGDVTHILRPEIPHLTQPFADDVPIKGPRSRYQRPDGSYEMIRENPGIRRFVWEHLQDVNRIVQRVKAYGATFSGKKAFIGVPRADILGHICTFEGRVADPSRIQAILDWPVPTNVSEVRSFLGTCGVLRIFIKNYTLIARPLIHLTRKDEPFEIGPAQLTAIDQLKSLIASSPALRPIDYASDRPVILAVDSCMNGVGFILLQVGEDKKRYPSRFGSIVFNDRESRYSQAKLELYGLFRALKQTQLFTIGVKKFIVEMDAKFIKGMLNSPALHPNDAINRWISAILLFDFDLVHVPADKRTGADGLSRRPRASDDPNPEDLTELEEWIDTNAGLFIQITTPPSNFDPVPPLVLAVTSEPDLPSLPPSSRQSPEPSIPRSAQALRREAKLATIREFLTTLKRPPDLNDRDYGQFIRQATDYFVQDQRLFRKARDGSVQLVPDPPDRLRLIEYAHDSLGHKGIFATTRNLLLRFWWPDLNEDVRWFSKTCHQCQTRQTEYFHIPPVVPLVPTLFRKAHIDTFLMPKLGSYRYVHHARDALTSYPEGRATTSDSAKVIADFIFQDILCRWGGLEELVTDNAAPYVAAADILAERYGIHHIRISGYNSRANGLIESKHFDVREAIMKTCQGVESKWREVLPQVFWAERVTIRKSTGYSPYYMAHGVHPLLPFDILEATYLSPTQDFGITTEELVAIRAQQLSKRPEDIAKMQETVTKSRMANLERFEKRFTSRITDFDFKPGALVLVRNSRIEEALNRKTKPRYVGPYVVVRKTVGTSYIVAELDGAQSRLRVAAFRVIPYFPRSKSSIPITSYIQEEEDSTKDDPEDVKFLATLDSDACKYSIASRPYF